MKLGESCLELQVIGLCATAFSEIPVGDVGLALLVDGCKDLKEIYLDYAYNVSQDAIIGLVELRGKQLTSLSLSDCSRFVRDDLVKIVAAQCPNLRRFAADHCPRVTPESLRHIMNKCGKLSTLVCDGFVCGVALSEVST